MKVTIILGTRPEIIKMSPIIQKCKKKCIKFNLHADHYIYKIDRIFEQLKLQLAKYNLAVVSGTLGKQMKKCLKGIEEFLV